MFSPYRSQLLPYSFLLSLSLSLSLHLSLFLPPTFSFCSLRPIDVEFMKHLHGYVNIVPVIAKADTLTIEERDSFKQRIREDLHFHGISIYPSAYGAEDEEDASANAKIEVRVRETLGQGDSCVMSSLSSLPSLSSLHPCYPPSLLPPLLPSSPPPSSNTFHLR